MDKAETQWSFTNEVDKSKTQGFFGGGRGEGGWGGDGVEGSRIELTKNKLILDQIYSTPPQSKQTINDCRLKSARSITSKVKKSFTKLSLVKSLWITVHIKEGGLKKIPGQ